MWNLFLVLSLSHYKWDGSFRPLFAKMIINRRELYLYYSLTYFTLSLHFNYLLSFSQNNGWKRNVSLIWDGRSFIVNCEGKKLVECEICITKNKVNNSLNYGQPKMVLPLFKISESFSFLRCLTISESFPFLVKNHLSYFIIHLLYSHFTSLLFSLSYFIISTFTL